MIENIQLLNREILFSTEESRKFQHLFPFGSLNLLIGENGSGKTNMLLGTAAILSRGSDFQRDGHYSLLNDEGVSQRSYTHIPPQGYGIVYFTPLPYRRSIRKSRNLIDASPRHSILKHTKSIPLFKYIARQLGCKTNLTGTLAFREDIFEKGIVPHLVDSRLELTNSYENELLREYRQLAENANRSPADILNSSFTDQSERVYTRQKEISEILTSRLISRLGEKFRDGGRFFGITSLACFEAIFYETQQKQRFVGAYLKHFDLVVDADISAVEYRTYSQMFSRTFEYLTDGRRDLSELREITDTEIRFIVDSDSTYSEISSAETPMKFRWDGLSSGLHALIDQFACLDYSISVLSNRGLRKIVILVDEGDAFLHLDWQRKYIKMLSIFLGNMSRQLDLKSLQVLIATHSPILAGDLPRCMVQNLDDFGGDSKTFGTALDDIVFQCFKSNSVGELAGDAIGELYRRIQSRQATDQDFALIDEIGDPLLKRTVLSAGGSPA